MVSVPLSKFSFTVSAAEVCWLEFQGLRLMDSSPGPHKLKKFVHEKE